jgi:capsular exopolysaccharide synthesis family protein
VDESVNVKRYLAILMKRKLAFIQVFILVMTVGIFGTLASVPIYQTSAKFVVSTPAPFVTIGSQGDSMNRVLQSLQPDSVATQLQLLQSAKFIRECEIEADISTSASVKAQAVRESGQLTNVVQVTVTGPNPADIAKMANTVVDQHIKTTKANQNSNLKGAIDFARSEMETAERDLKSTTDALVSFRRTNRVEQGAAERAALSAKFAQSRIDMEQAQANIRVTQLRVARLKRELAGASPELVRVQHRPNADRAAIAELLRGKRILRADKAQEYRDDAPVVVELDAEIRSLEAQLKQAPEEAPERTSVPNPRYDMLSGLLLSAESDLYKHEQELSTATATFTSVRGQVPTDTAGDLRLTTLTQDQARAYARRNSLEDKIKDLEMQERTTLTTARPIETASAPGSPIAPRKTLNIIVTLALALLLGAGVAFGLEYLDDRVDEPDDIRAVCAAPALGFVPALQSDEARLITEPEHSAAAEAYRTLRSSIGFAAVDHPLHTVVVTSATKGDGKSLTCVNLATAMALDGKKVIIVDADLRRPTLHRLLNLPNNVGLSAVLLGSTNLRDALCRTEMESLRALPAGAIPPNPAELLGSIRFRQILAELKDEADVVLFDSPPCLPVTDPVILAAQVDGVVLVIGAGSTRKFDVHHTISLLENARANLIGFVLNRVETSKRGYYYYSYYYRQYGDYGPTEEGERRSRKRRRTGGTARASLPAGGRSGRENGHRRETVGVHKGGHEDDV